MCETLVWRLEPRHLPLTFASYPIRICLCEVTIMSRVHDSIVLSLDKQRIHEHNEASQDQQRGISNF